MRTLFHFTLIVWLTAMAWAAGPRTEWLRSAGGPAYDEGLAACADSEGNLIVAGMIQGTATFGGTNLTSDQGGVLAKYSSAGNLLWARGLPSLPAAGGSWPRTLAADAQGNIHVAGEMQVVLAPTNGSTLNYIYRLFVSKYDPTGSLLWTVARTNGNFNTGAEGGGVWVYGSALDTAGNFYVAGDFSGSFFIGSTNLHDNGSGWTDFFFAKFSSTGNLLWVLDGGTNAFDSAHGIALGQNGRSMAYCTAWLSRAERAESNNPHAIEDIISSNRMPKKCQGLPKSGTPSTLIMSTPKTNTNAKVKRV